MHFWTVWGLPYYSFGSFYYAAILFSSFGLVFLYWTVCVLVVVVVAVVYWSQFVTHSSNAWRSVSCLFISFFGNEDFSPSLLLCSFSSFHPLVLCFSTPFPTWNEISRRMVTKSNCFIWMMHPGIYVLFFKVIVIGFYCVAHLNLFFLHINLMFSCFLYMDWLCLFTSHLHPLHDLSHLCLVHVWCGSAAIVFDWSLCCIRRLLIG